MLRGSVLLRTSSRKRLKYCVEIDGLANNVARMDPWCARTHTHTRAQHTHCDRLLLVVLIAVQTSEFAPYRGR